MFKISLSLFIFTFIATVISQQQAAIDTGLQSFDICHGPAIISAYDVENGYIHSPSYPNYYGNNRDCSVKILLFGKYRLNLNIVHMNMEGLGFFSRKPKDFLQISIDNSKYFGSQSSLQLLSNITDDVTLNFQSDFITSRTLPFPKGFLLHFSISKIAVPTTTLEPTTTTEETTTTTTMITTTTAQIEIDLNTPTKELLINHELHAFESLRDPGHLSGKDRSMIITFTLILLLAIIILLLISILLLLRRRQKQDESDYYEDNYVTIIKNFFQRHKSPLLLSKSKNGSNEPINKEISSSEQIKVEKEFAVKQSDIENQNLNSGNVYAPSPLLNEKKDDEDINHGNIELYTYVILPDNDSNNNTNENEQMTNEQVYETINEIYNNCNRLLDENNDENLAIYSTPSNKVLTNEEKQKFHESLNGIKLSFDGRSDQNQSNC